MERQMMTLNQALELTGGYLPPEEADYDTQTAFYEDLRAFFKLYLTEAEKAGFDINALTLLAGEMPLEFDAAYQRLSRLSSLASHDALDKGYK
jgi:hypothetical protein